MSKYFKFAILLGLVLFELAALIYIRPELPVKASVLLQFAASLSVGLVALYFAKNKFIVDTPISQKSSKFNPINIKIVSGIFIVGTALNIVGLKGVFDKVAITVANSDIIPTVEIYCKRLLNGNNPYTIITEFGYDLFPNYVTFKWFPYLISTYFNFDHRWLAFAIFSFAALFYFKDLLKQKLNVVSTIILSILPFLFIQVLIGKEHLIFGNTLEIMDVGLYIILIASFFSNNKWFRAIAVTLCLLARYSFLLWLPLLFLIILKEENVKETLQTAGLIIAGVLLFYVFPFVLNDIELYAKGMAYYDTAALGEWRGQSWQPAGAKPHSLFMGIGFACYFHDFIDGDLAMRLEALQRVHLSLSALSVLLLGGFYWFYRQQYDYRLFALISLKIYFVFFYHFIQVPYSYLLIIPLFTSVCLLMYLSPFLITKPTAE